MDKANFDFLEKIPELASFYHYCHEAEIFALSYPDISVTSSRKAMEYMVKLLYGSAINENLKEMTVFDMLADPDFVIYMDDRALLGAFHFIRKKGNMAVHQGGMSPEEATETLEQLHFLAGETAIRLNLISDYPAFDKALLSVSLSRPKAGPDATEPAIDSAIIARFSGRMHNVYHFSELSNIHPAIIDSFVDARIVCAQKKTGLRVQGTDFAGNSRVAFRQVAQYFLQRLGEENVAADYTQQQLRLNINGRPITVAVKTGSGRVAVKSSKGEWVYLPGVASVIYTQRLTADMPVLEQMRVFTREEYLNLWRELDMIIPRLGAGYRKMLRQSLGADVELPYQEYANELALQNLNTMRREKRERLQQVLDGMPTLENGGFEKIVQCVEE